ncbi:MAG: hypothetical protein LBC95_00920, partial [Candidatus Nomurabacteria bacterium]|nr:hypothetical protein [Candidatus Nomurabacteria bacterium]
MRTVCARRSNVSKFNDVAGIYGYAIAGGIGGAAAAGLVGCAIECGAVPGQILTGNASQGIEVLNANLVV